MASKKVSIKIDGKTYTGTVSSGTSTGTKKRSTRKQSAMGKKIMAEAKRIRKKSPNKKWTDCVKEAGKKLKK